MTKWLLIIFFTDPAGSWTNLPDRVEKFSSKESCMEVLEQLKQQPEKYYLAYCTSAEK
jgi:hypothetical protein